MWPFSKKDYRYPNFAWADLAQQRLDVIIDQSHEIEDLKDSNERLADALAAAKERAGE